MRRDADWNSIRNDVQFLQLIRQYNQVVTRMHKFSNLRSIDLTGLASKDTRNWTKYINVWEGVDNIYSIPEKKP